MRLPPQLSAIFTRVHPYRISHLRGCFSESANFTIATFEMTNERVTHTSKLKKLLFHLANNFFQRQTEQILEKEGQEEAAATKLFVFGSLDKIVEVGDIPVFFFKKKGKRKKKTRRESRNTWRGVCRGGRREFLQTCEEQEHQWQKANEI